MPAELRDIDEFVELSKKAEYCIVKRLDQNAKLKLRTPRRLYTIKVEYKDLESILKRLDCRIIEK